MSTQEIAGDEKKKRRLSLDSWAAIAALLAALLIRAGVFRHVPW